MEPFYIINKIPKINRAHWNLPWMSCILKFRSLKISLETLERSFHREEKTEIGAKHHGIYEIPPFGLYHNWFTYKLKHSAYQLLILRWMEI